MSAFDLTFPSNDISAMVHHVRNAHLDLPLRWRAQAGSGWIGVLEQDSRWRGERRGARADGNELG